MMKHFGRSFTVVRHLHPTLAVRGEESVPSGDVGTTQESPQSTVVSHKMPTSTMVAVIVLTITVVLAITLAVVFVSRSRKSKGHKKKRIISAPLNAKHVTHDSASDISERKRAFGGSISDGSSIWRHASNDDDKYMEATKQLSGWASSPLTTPTITVPKPSLKTKPSRLSAKVLRRLSRLGVPPPPSYSAAFAGIGGIDEEMMAMKYPTPSSKPDPTSMPDPEPCTRMEARPPVVATAFMLEGSSGRPSRSSSIIKLVSSALNAVKDSSQASSTSAPAPKLMAVINTFTPTLEDELALTIGDTVRMLEEFKDGWCNVQYLGKDNAAKGAVPRFCLQERPAVPSHKIC